MSSNDYLDYAAWLAQYRSTTARPLTGWIVWSGALHHHGVRGMAVTASRPSFDQWLAEATAAGDWFELDAWRAGAAYCERHPPPVDPT